ncbi:hypothetical protein [Phenylobacterium sp.]|uniref:tetratricopeptide repeat protein n=1 Tax=Phenylobacterium sp. TaxID=1871053 RepID=UPI002810C035|nr:hypothetical protein [Phenylobacterium sp.]
MTHGPGDVGTRRRPAGGITAYALTAGAIALGWQILLQPVVERAPVALAARVAPGSAQVLSRAAEAELAANRDSNASALAREALRRAPFDVRALRVLGLAEARAERLQSADDLLTLAGNWSLRDDPSHAWLIERRLRRGDYASSFAHADTLLRRREDLWPRIFRLFSVAAVSDPNRALPVIAKLLEANAPWRLYFLNSLYQTPDGMRVAMALAFLLKDSEAPLSNIELHQLYSALLSIGQVEAVRTVRQQLGRPAADLTVTNGEFSDTSSPLPFQWEPVQQSGAEAEITGDDAAEANTALWVQYDGYSSAIIARQFTLLRPGRYRFEAHYRSDNPAAAGRMLWRINCVPPASPVLSTPAVGDVTPSSTGWSRVTEEFIVPANCPGQWLELEGRPADRRQMMTVWFDRVSITPLTAPAS